MPGYVSFGGSQTHIFTNHSFNKNTSNSLKLKCTFENELSKNVLNGFKMNTYKIFNLKPGCSGIA